MEYCRKSLQIKPDCAEAYNTLGNALLSQNEPDAAADSFRMAIHFNAGYFFAHNNLGNALQRLGRFEDAVQCYRQAIQLRPDYHEAHNNLGRTLKSLGRIGESYACFLKALDLRPDYRKAARSLAEVDPVWLEPLLGKRIRLRRYREEDAAYLRLCYQDVSFMRQYNHYIPPHQTLESLIRKLRKTQDMHPCQIGTIDWIILKSDNAEKWHPIGLINLVDIQFVFRRAELLMGIPAPSERTAGVALEAILLAMDFAFNKVRLNKLTTVVYGDNPQSQRNTLSLGFMQESYLREQICEAEGDQFIDLYGNGMTEKDFRRDQRLGRWSRRLLGRDITVA